MKKIILLSLLAVMVITISSCYKDYYDVSSSTLSSINSVSFRNDVVPIVVSGNCGCHNNGSTGKVAFSHLDTIFYSTILIRAAILDSMANGTKLHPGEGSVGFTASQAATIEEWYAQGAKDDYVAPLDTSDVTYSGQIVPIYNTICKGSTCHGGQGPVLTYSLLVQEGPIVLVPMMKSLGASSHPGGVISLDQTTASTFLAWIDQGYQQ